MRGWQTPSQVVRAEMVSEPRKAWVTRNAALDLSPPASSALG